MPSTLQIKLLSVFTVWVTVGLSAAAAAERELISWNTKQLSPDFYGEGAFYGDFNKDGAVDIVSGPFWYQGPEFSKKHEYRPAKPYNPEGYSDNFLTFVYDFNKDGWDDILIIGWPGYRKGHEHVWYENPKDKQIAWPKHDVFKEVDNESPAFGNLVGDENPELIFHYKGHLGWASPDPKDPTKPWTFHKISENLKLTRYAHGLGFGDINGDGRVDFVQSKGWWEQPKSIEGDPVWKHHTWPFKLDGAQMLVYDVDGDGDNDIVTSIACHKYGIAWMEHTKASDGTISFKMHRFMNSKPEENRYGVKFSQPHALDTADFNGDGITDFVVGKRFWAHGPKGDPEPNAAAGDVLVRTQTRGQGRPWWSRFRTPPYPRQFRRWHASGSWRSQWRRLARRHFGQQEGHAHSSAGAKKGERAGMERRPAEGATLITRSRPRVSPCRPVENEHCEFVRIS